MLRTNLSTRPFYNTRAAQAILGSVALIVALMTIGNIFQLVRLTSSERALGARAAQAEADSARLRDEAKRIRSQINAKELEEVAAAADEANGIIDLRAFSWTVLFDELEKTLPESVRLTRFQPRVDQDGQFKVNVRVQAKQVQDLETFLDALEKTGVFHDVLASEEQTDEDGLINASVEGAYTPPVRAGVPPPPLASADKKGAAGE